MATMAGVLFGLAFLFAPVRGVVSRMRAAARASASSSRSLMLAIHLLHHEGTAEAATETREDHLHQHLRWKTDRARRVVDDAVSAGLVERESDGRLSLTDAGRARAREGMLTSATGAVLAAKPKMVTV